MAEEYKFPVSELQGRAFALSNVLASKSTRFTVEEQKLFYLTLASVKPKQEGNIIEINKKALVDVLGFESRDIYTRLRPMFEKMAASSWIKYNTEDGYDDGFLFTRIKTTKHKVLVTVDERYVPLLIKLAPGFTMLLVNDVVKFKSKYSQMLYQKLMSLNNQGEYGVGMTTKQLKDLFGLSVDDYVYNGNFNRALFEKKTIDFAIKDINSTSKCISNLSYTKKKQGNRVQGYVFHFDYISPEKVKEKAYNHMRNVIHNYDPTDETVPEEDIIALKKEIDAMLGEKQTINGEKVIQATFNFENE